jgi:uncharacterized lipoprotein YajG
MKSILFCLALVTMLAGCADAPSQAYGIPASSSVAAIVR